MLQLYLLGAEDAERILLTEFSSEDLDLLAEIFEGQSSTMRPAIEFVEGMPAYLRTVSREVGLADDETAAHLRWLASTIDSQTIAERIAVLDFLQRNGAVHWMLEGEQTA